MSIRNIPVSLLAQKQGYVCDLLNQITGGQAMYISDAAHGRTEFKILFDNNGQVTDSELKAKKEILDAVFSQSPQKPYIAYLTTSIHCSSDDESPEHADAIQAQEFPHGIRLDDRLLISENISLLEAAVNRAKLCIAHPTSQLGQVRSGREAPLVNTDAKTPQR